MTTLNDNSMRSSDSVASRVRLHKQNSKRFSLIVEGSDDLLVLRDHLQAVDIFPADGKINVLRAVRTLVSWGVKDVIGVFDRDYDDLADVSDIKDFIYPYDNRDLEMMLIGLGVLKLVIEHQGSTTKIRACGGADALIEKVLSAASIVSAIRSASRQAQWGLRFDAVDLSKKVDAKSLLLNSESYCNALLSASQTNAGLAALKSVAFADVDDLGPRGKDVLAVVGVALRKVAGSLPQAAASESVMVGQLHSSAGLKLSTSVWLKNLLDRVDPRRDSSLI